MLLVQERSSVMCTPRNLVLLTLSTVAPLMVRGSCRECTLLKSPTISFVFFTFRERLLSLHHPARRLTSLLYFVSSLLLMRPTTVVSSANLMKRLELFDGVQSWVSRVNTSAHILGGPCVQCDGAGCVTADPYCLRSPGQKVQQPVAQ